MATGLIVEVLSAVLAANPDPTPEPEDVKAGWTGLIVFLLLIAAVVFLAFSFVKQLRKAEAARKAGAFGPVKDDEEPESDPADADHDADQGSEPRQAP